MPNYRRNRLAGGTFFFTVVTASRRPVLCRSDVRSALRVAVEHTRSAYPFDIVAWALLPDHLHCVWRLPVGDADYPRRWRLIKSRTTKLVAAASKWFPLWQARYWEHTIRDDHDLRQHGVTLLFASGGLDDSLAARTQRHRVSGRIAANLVCRRSPAARLPSPPTARST